MQSTLDLAKLARAASGKSWWRLSLEALRARRAPQQVGLSEYFAYGLWSPGLDDVARSRFIGWRKSAVLDQALNAPSSRVLANDKLVSYSVLQQQGLPMPEPLATYTASGRTVGRERPLRTLDEVRAYLHEAVYPFYVKPISAGYGRGVLGVSDRDGAELCLMDGKRLAIDELLASFRFAPFGGMLFQRPLRAHPSIQALTGTAAVSCVRFICFVTPSGTQVHTAFWKVATGKNMLDNFSHGDYGNLLAAVDLHSGRIERAIRQLGPGGEVQRHPDTQTEVVGFQLPDWEAAKALVLRASVHFPGLRLQNWDVALCPEGPVLVEINTESELAVPQAISGRGLMDERLEAILGEIEAEDRRHREAVASRG